MRVDWHLTNRCNFRCAYCHPQIRRVLDSGPQEPSVEVIVQGFDSLADSCEILMSGGEPFLFPKFSELCSRLCKRHTIRINTNLSCLEEIGRFVKEVPSESVIEIAAAIHIEERRRLGVSLESFSEAYALLKSSGFPVYAIYVLHPDLLPSAIEEIKNIKLMGVDDIRGKVFKGAYNGKRYPDSYTPIEKEIILSLSGGYPKNSNYLNVQMGFHGKMCGAGYCSVKVNVDGSIQRCATVRTSLGNLYSGELALMNEPRPCTANRVLALSECHALLLEKPHESV